MAPCLCGCVRRRRRCLPRAPTCVCIPHAFRGVPDVLLLYPHKQTELGVLQRAMEGLQQRLEEAERDKRQASELHSSSTSKVRRFFLSFCSQTFDNRIHQLSASFPHTRRVARYDHDFSLAQGLSYPSSLVSCARIAIPTLARHLHRNPPPPPCHPSQHEYFPIGCASPTRSLLQR